MEKKYKMSKEAREEEIKSRIVREEPNPILMGNGVHREAKNEAQKIEKERTLERAKIERKDNEKGAMKTGKMVRENRDIVKEN